MSINTVDKVNKGTSRDQWGNFNYWGFKAPDGKVRCRVSDVGVLDVRYFDPAKLPSYRKQMDWESAQFIGSSYIEISDKDKGPTSAGIAPEINALIEGYNDAHTKWVGKKVCGAMTLTATDKISIEVEYVAVEIDAEAIMSTMLSGKLIGRGYGNHRIRAEASRELSEDDYLADLEKAIEAEKAKVRKGNEFLQKALYAVERGNTLLDDVSTYGAVGCVTGTDAGNIARLVNALAEQRATV